MLIKFESTGASAPFVMLDKDAQLVLRDMSQDDSLEGAVSGQTLNDALTHLEEALAAAALAEAEQESTDDEISEDEDDVDAPRPVNSDARAAPLLAMLRKAQAEDSSVMWKPE